MDKPWLEESDYEEFFYRGIECVVMRVINLKTLCGYIGIEEGHKHYKKEYFDFKVHGGITYSGTSLPNGTKSGKWWLGFDTMHSGDLIPLFCDSVSGYPNLFFVNGPVYRDINYVKEQLENLVDQVLI